MNERERARTPAGRRITSFCAETGVGRTKLLTLPHALRPESVLVGRSRIILEDPAAWLRRIGAPRADGAIYRLTDRRQDGDPRVVASFQDPAEAQAALSALRGAGDATANLQIIASVDPLVDQAAP